MSFFGKSTSPRASYFRFIGGHCDSNITCAAHRHGVARRCPIQPPPRGETLRKPVLEGRTKGHEYPASPLCLIGDTRGQPFRDRGSVGGAPWHGAAAEYRRGYFPADGLGRMFCWLCHTVLCCHAAGTARLKVAVWQGRRQPLGFTALLFLSPWLRRLGCLAPRRSLPARRPPPAA